MNNAAMDRLARQPWTAKDLRNIASDFAHDNHCPGEPGFCSPSKADWTLELVHPDSLENVFASPGEARTWLEAEIRMSEEDGLGRDWKSLLVEDVREEIVMLIRDGKAYVWDGYHRAAAAIAKGVPIVAIVGRPKPALEVRQSPALPMRQPDDAQRQRLAASPDEHPMPRVRGPRP